ncbi:MAG: hypothetical protein ACLP6E_03830 [Acidimicrobiales bacterium]
MHRSTIKSIPGAARRRWALVPLLAAVAVTAAACSSGTSGASTSSSSSSTTPAAASGTTTTGGGALAVSSDMAASVGTVLTGPNGHTLYHLTTETNGQIKCTGSCSQEWPPLTVSAGQTPKLASGMTGTIGTVKRPDGTTQVTYDGHPLYYYAADTAAGQATGQGVGGVWFAVTPAGASNSSSSSSVPTTTTTTSGGYSY